MKPNKNTFSNSSKEDKLKEDYLIAQVIIVLSGVYMKGVIDSGKSGVVHLKRHAKEIIKLVKESNE